MFDNLRPANSPRLAVLCFLCEDKVSYTKLWRQFQEGCILFSRTSNLQCQTWHFESLCSHSGGRWWIVVCSCVVPLPLTAAVCVCCVKVATHPHPHGSEEKATPDRPTKRHGVSVSSAVFRHATLFSVLILLSGNGDTSDCCEDSDIFTRLCWINTSRLEGSVSCVQQTHTGGDNVITPCVFFSCAGGSKVKSRAAAECSWCVVIRLWFRLIKKKNGSKHFIRMGVTVGRQTQTTTAAGCCCQFAGAGLITCHTTRR